MNAVDTNIFVYALSADEPIRGPKAADFDRSALGVGYGVAVAGRVRVWRGGVEAVSRAPGIGGGLRSDRGYSKAILARASPAVLDVALDLHRNHEVSYWDAMLLAACEDAGVKRLLTEDLQDGATFLGVRVVNPLKS